MEDNKKCFLFPFRWSSSMQKIINAVKYWIINWFVSENNTITWRDKGQVIILSTAGDWIEAIPVARLCHTKYRELSPPLPPGSKHNILLNRENLPWWHIHMIIAL